jgi:hypothetical protein
MDTSTIKQLQVVFDDVTEANKFWEFVLTQEASGRQSPTGNARDDRPSGGLKSLG